MSHRMSPSRKNSSSSLSSTSLHPPKKGSSTDNNSKHKMTAFRTNALPSNSPQNTSNNNISNNSTGIIAENLESSIAIVETGHESNRQKEEPLQKNLRIQRLNLTEAELKEEIPRVLTANDPQIPMNLVQYSYKSQSYERNPPSQADMLAVHFSIDGFMIHKDSLEAAQQKEFKENKRQQRIERLKKQQEEAIQAGEEAFLVVPEETIDEDSDNQNAEKATGVEAAAVVSAKGKIKKATACRNTFNYCERAVQSLTYSSKEKCVGTEPPPVVNFQGMCSQWEIYDIYLADFYKRQQELQLTAKSDSSSSSPDDNNEGSHHLESKSLENALGGSSSSAKILKPLTMIEHMVTQNAEDATFNYFKYWGEEEEEEENMEIAEQHREEQEQGQEEKPLLHLWSFTVGEQPPPPPLSQNHAHKKRHVTAFSWNTRHVDLFAVESGVTSLDFHPQHPFLLAVGCYDGNVLVFDVRQKINRPIYASCARTKKHTDPVWGICWHKEPSFGRELGFHTVSSDGHVASWILSKDELKMEVILPLTLASSPVNEEECEEEDISSKIIVSTQGFASGCCLDFNPEPNSEHLFLVGTEEGKIHKCSKAYSGQYLETYEAHHLTVYAVRWNPFHPQVFLSCSADWSIKLWDHLRPASPLLSFDLGNAVIDVQWSPFSSTVFAAATMDGRVHVFDLTVNKLEALCRQRVLKSKPTRLCFNPQYPLLLVGDEKGQVISLKLSSKLRRRHEPRDAEGNIIPHDPLKLQIYRIDKILENKLL